MKIIFRHFLCNDVCKNTIFTDKKGYGLSDNNEEVCIQEDEMCKVKSRDQKNVKE